jgi:hypothetical protein
VLYSVADLDRLRLAPRAGMALEGLIIDTDSSDDTYGVNRLSTAPRAAARH